MALDVQARPIEALEGFDAFVRAIMQQWSVPGLAIAVAKDGEIIRSQGFGLRDVAQGLPVTPRTLFAIGSASKAFTTMALGLLADEGKLDWDTPVRSYIPTFKLRDPFATEQMTPRDLVTHRSGLPRHDLMWYNSTATRKELFDRLQYLEPARSFRSLWQYQNLMYMTAGYLVEVVSGLTWEEFVRQRIFGALGMATSNTSVDASRLADDFSLPYREKDEETREIPFRNIDTVGPAGSINSSVEDMARWLLLHLHEGKLEGEQIVGAAQIAQMHAPQMVIPDPSKHRELAHASYGLGWFVQPYRGHNMIHHGGNIDGFSALVVFLPDDHIGAVVLTNLDATPVPSILAYNIFDRLLGLDHVPWSDRFWKDHEEYRAAEKRGVEKSAAEAVPHTAPSHPLASYTGDFADPGYGVLTVSLDGDRLQATYNQLDFPLTHYHYDVFNMDYERFDIHFKASFGTNVKGDIESITVGLEPTVRDIVFKRLPPKEMTDRAFLERFVGQYELMEMTVAVTLKEGALIIALPMQPEYELTPYRGTEFEIKGISGVRVEFKSDDTGAIAEAVITQPGGVFTAKRK